MISRILKLAALFFLFVLIAGTSAYLTLTLIIKSEDTVVVPDLSGKNVVYVLELLTDLGLNTKVKGSEYSADVPENIVYIITREIFNNLEDFKKLHPAYGVLTKHNMLEALSAPIHPGAMKYYKEAGLTIPPSPPLP